MATDPLGAASVKVWPRVLGIARRELADKVGAEETESADSGGLGGHASVSRGNTQASPGKDTIKDLEGFLVGTFQHRLSRAIVKEKDLAETIEFLPSTEELAELKNARDEDWARDLENELLIKELLRRMDEWTRTVWMELRYGYSWKKIAKHLGMTVQQVKMRFRYNIEKLRRQIEGEDPREEPPDAR